MSGMEIAMAFVGMIICSVIFALVGILFFAIVRWMLRTDFELSLEEKNEEETNENV